VTPLVLALDTTNENGSIALVRGAETIVELPVHSPDGFAHAIYGHLDALLRQHRVALADIDIFAAASGPGSFTGVRVGLACVKGLAEALGKRAAGVSNLRAIASLGSAPLRAPVLDARRGEVYGAIYDAEGKIVQQESVGKFETWLAALPGEGVEILSPDVSAENVAIVRTPRELAAAIARLAPAAAADPAALDANYVRRSDAELFWKEI
jgi:tRNA threonylcarbamoyladenosine biosynthesis protein TsaB